MGPTDEIGLLGGATLMCRVPADRLGSVPARPFFSCKLEEKPDSVALFFKVMNERLARRANPPPPTRETRLTEKGFGDLKRVISRHVFRGISALDI